MNMFASHQAGTFQYIWLVWILAFVIIELAALWVYRKHPTEEWKGGTLSELVWRSFKRRWYTFVILLVFLAVLGIHFVLAI